MVSEVEGGNDLASAIWRERIISNLILYSSVEIIQPFHEYLVSTN